MNSPFTAQMGGVFEGGLFAMPTVQGMDFFGDSGFGQETSVVPAPPAGYVLLKNPYYVANQALTANAQASIAAFEKYVAIIPSLKLQAQMDAANAILSKNWYGKGFLGLAGSNLKELYPDIKTYAAEGVFQQYNIEPTGAIYQSDTRAKKLKAFSDGVRELYRYMDQFLPVQVITKTTISEVGLTAVNLIGKATQAAAIARSSRTVDDAATARAYALAAVEAATIEDNPTIVTAGQGITDEMNAIIQAAGAAGGGVIAIRGGQDKGTSPWVYVGIAGGVVVVLVAAYFFLKD